MTIKEILAAAARRLKRARITEARLEAESLLAHALKRDPSTSLGAGLAWVLAHQDEPIAKMDGRTFLKSVASRAKHVPFAQIVGEQGFYGRVFRVTKDVLIPRPETELLVEAVLARAKGDETILDVGTGSGAIALTMAAELPKAKVTACDISTKALAVARKNARRLKLAHRVRFLKRDARYLVTEGQVIVANLPYLPLTAWKRAQPEVRRHEPKLALVSGRDGLDHYRALFKNLVRRKRPPALLALEAEPGQFETLAKLVREALPGARVEILKDLHGDARVLVAQTKTPA